MLKKNLLRQNLFLGYKQESFKSSYQGTFRILNGMLLKPEAFKSNIPGYVRGRSAYNLSTPEWVEVVNMKIYS
jgi:hypothetical protein